MTLFQSLVIFLPLGITIIGMFVRVEHRLTKIEVDLKWLKVKHSNPGDTTNAK